MNKVIPQLIRPRLCSAQQQSDAVGARPPVDLCKGDFRVELQSDGRASIREGLIVVGRRSRGEEVRAARQVEPFAVPLKDVIRHAAVAQPGRSGSEWVVADLDGAGWAVIDARAEMMREHLGAETNPQERLALAERDADPIDFTLDVSDPVVGALRTAEDHRSAVRAQGLGQRLTIVMPANVEGMAIAAKPLPDVTGVGVDLMNDDEHGFSPRARPCATRLVPDFVTSRLVPYLHSLPRVVSAATRPSDIISDVG